MGKIVGSVRCGEETGFPSSVVDRKERWRLVAYSLSEQGPRRRGKKECHRRYEEEREKRRGAAGPAPARAGPTGADPTWTVLNQAEAA